jgi:SAM-dependent methyltransferase
VTSVRPVAGRDQALRLLARYVSGNGIELGPGHVPFPLPYPATAARYVDRWKPDENRVLFPELDADAAFPMPDIVADLNVDRLSMLADMSQDFVIASHVLEHLVDPLAHLAEIHRVLRPGGIALILLPDRRLTFDRDRPPTSLEHLIAEHAAGSRTVDDAHLEEALRGGNVWDDNWDATQREAQLELHRQRSIHVHCWTQEEFLPVLSYAVTDLGLSLELLDGLFHEDVPGGIEFGFVLRRCLSDSEPSALDARLGEVWSELVEEHRGDRDGVRDSAEATDIKVQLAASDRYVREVVRNAEAVQAELDRIRSKRAFRAASTLNRWLKRVARR